MLTPKSHSLSMSNCLLSLWSSHALTRFTTVTRVQIHCQYDIVTQRGGISQYCYRTWLSPLLSHSQYDSLVIHIYNTSCATIGSRSQTLVSLTLNPIMTDWSPHRMPAMRHTRSSLNSSLQNSHSTTIFTPRFPVQYRVQWRCSSGSSGWLAGTLWQVKNWGSNRVHHLQVNSGTMRRHRRPLEKESKDSRVTASHNRHVNADRSDSSTVSDVVIASQRCTHNMGGFL